MSYARFNDDHDDGQLTAFRGRLAAEVRAQTGDEFPIFQDRADIAWGQNWRELRFEPLTSPAARKAMALLASRMRDAFWQPSAVPRGVAGVRGTEVAAKSRASAVEPGAQGQVTAKSDPPTHVVDAYQRENFDTVGAAVKAAKPGDRILVRPGLYREALVIDKPLEILGDGPVADIEIRASGAHVVSFKANIGRIANLTLRQAGGEGSLYGVDITQGRLDLEGCDITSQSWSGVAIRDGADPRLRRNIVHDGMKTGVIVYRGGLGTLEDNDITANTRAGVEIRTSGNPTLRRNRINRNGGEAAWVHDGGRGVFEDNDLTDNKKGAWKITAGSEDNVTRARNQE